jgi:hypothetical protein
MGHFCVLKVEASFIFVNRRVLAAIDQVVGEGGDTEIAEDC